MDYFYRTNHNVRSKQEDMEVLQARGALDWQEIINKLIKMSASIIRKNIKNPISWLIEL